MKLGPHSGLGTWTGARVAPLRSPILRPGGIGSNVSESVLQLVKEFSKQPRQRHRAVWRSISERPSVQRGVMGVVRINEKFSRRDLTCSEPRVAFVVRNFGRLFAACWSWAGSDRE